MKNEKFNRVATFLALVLLSALAYLILAPKFGFHADDWYSIYGASTRGTEAFWQIFSFDRPARAILMIPLYNLFGASAPLYSYSGYAVRLVGALFFYWMLDGLWPRRQWVGALAALLYLIYPGFLEQPNAFDYQSHMWSISAGLISIAFSVRAQDPGLKRLAARGFTTPFDAIDGILSFADGVFHRPGRIACIPDRLLSFARRPDYTQGILETLCGGLAPGSIALAGLPGLAGVYSFMDNVRKLIWD